MQDTVVYDGECSLIIPLVGEASLTNVLDGECGVITRYREADYPVYTGATEVNPLFTEQVLPTREKCLLDDLTVNAINVAYVSNLQGGQTAYIGGEFING